MTEKDHKKKKKIKKTDPWGAQSNLVKMNSDKTNNSLVRTFPGQMVGQAFSLVKTILTNNWNTNFWYDEHFLRFVGIKSTDNTNFLRPYAQNHRHFERKVQTFEFSKASGSTKRSLKSFFLCLWSFYYFLKSFIFTKDHPIRAQQHLSIVG